MSDKDDILDKIRAHSQRNTNDFGSEPDWNADELKLSNDNLSLAFKFELEKVSGQFFEVDDYNHAGILIKDLLSELSLEGLQGISEQLSSKLAIKSSSDIDSAALIECESLIAASGSVLVSSAVLNGRKNMILPPVVFVLAYSSQLVPFLKDGLNALKSKYSVLPSMISLITGPSRTADIEKTLVLGAHGPKKLIVLLLPENN